MIPKRVVMAMLVLAAPVAAQTSGVIDEAAFTYTRDGLPFGTESFKIVRRLGSEGPEYLAQCTRTMEGRIVKTSLTADSTGSPTNYTRNTTGLGAGQLTARRGLNRLTVNQAYGQTSSRDYVFQPGTLILDDDVIHQLYFVTWRDAKSVDYIAPGGRVATDGVTEVGRENLVIGGATIPSMKFTFGSGDGKREIWVDSERRLLKVSYPAQRIIGIRDLPPR